MITQAQRTAVGALDLPFALSDADIERQFEADGTAKPREQRDPMNRVRDLARSAMNDQAGLPKAA